MARTRVEIEGLDRLISDIGRLERFPVNEINAAALKGAKIVERAVNAAAPDGKTGELKGSFVSLKGHPRRESVGFYDVRVDPSKKNIFSKRIKVKGKFGGTRDTAFYPAAVEFGHKSGNRLTKRGTKRKGKAGNFVKGVHYMRKAATAKTEEVLTVITQELAKDVDRILRGR